MCLFYTDTATTHISTLSLHDALPICCDGTGFVKNHLSYILESLETFCISKKDSLSGCPAKTDSNRSRRGKSHCARSEEHTSELQSRVDLVCRLLLEKKNKKKNTISEI